MRPELIRVLDLAQTLAPDELAVLLGELETIRIIAHGRLNAPAVETRPDESLTVKQAAKRLGVSSDFVYRNQKRFAKFSRREGRKLLFSSSGLDAYLKRSR